MSSHSSSPDGTAPERDEEPRASSRVVTVHPRDILRRLHLSPRKSMGQNFLVDDKILRAIVARAGVRPGQVVLEIGPGLGALTRHLKASGAQIIALEKDRGYAAYLQEAFAGDEQVRIEQGDALEWDLAQLPGEPGQRRVIANLPYNVAVPILFRLIGTPGLFQDLHVMVQKEVADRMWAPPSTEAYGALTVNLGVLAEAAPVLDVPPGAFYPPPKVTSAVVRLVPRAHPPFELGDPAVFRQVVRAAFGERRKTLRNALTGGGFGRARADQALSGAGIDGMRRGETLSLEEFSRLSVLLSQTAGPMSGTDAG